MANYINNIYRAKTTPTYPLVSAIGRICQRLYSLVKPKTPLSIYEVYIVGL